jgi:hypothetical protein
MKTPREEQIRKELDMRIEWQSRWHDLYEKAYLSHPSHPINRQPRDPAAFAETANKSHVAVGQVDMGRNTENAGAGKITARNVVEIQKEMAVRLSLARFLEHQCFFFFVLFQIQPLSQC